MPSSFSLDGRVALITGSSRGLGLTIAEGLAEAGARVILNGRDGATLDAAVGRLLDKGLEVDARAFDVTNEGEVKTAVDEIERNLGGIHILVNNAGIQIRGALLSMTRRDWDTVLDTNLTAVFTVSTAVARHMTERRAGKIINICSLMSEATRPGVAPYTAAKGGLKMLTKSMAVEWGPSNIQCNGIGPGYFKTEQTQSLADDPTFDAWIRSITPAGRWGDPKELQGAATFLASAASSFVNGQVLYVDGGILAGL